MWAILVQIGIGLGMWGIGWLSKVNPRRAPESTDSLPKMLTTGEPGMPTPLLFGTVRVAPLVVWTGFEELINNEPGSSTVTPAGFKPVYRVVDLFCVLGSTSWDEGGDPWFAWRNANPPELRAIYVGEKRVEFNPPLLHGESRYVRVERGGPGAGGVFVADIEFYDGRANQKVYNYPSGPQTGFEKALIKKALAETGEHPFDHTPHWRHQVCVAVLMDRDVISFGEHGCLGEANAPVDIEFEVSVAGPQPVGA